MNLYEKREIIDGYLRNVDLKEKRKPYLFEIVEHTKLGTKAVKYYLKDEHPDYPQNLMITREEKQILDIYHRCKCYGEVSKMTDQSYIGCYERIQRLIGMGLIDEIRPTRKRLQEREGSARYFKVKCGKYQGYGGYTKSFAVGIIPCTIYAEGMAKNEDIDTKDLMFYNE